MVKRLRLGFFGPLSGQTSGWVTSQGEIIAHLFAGEGYPVRLASHAQGRLGRLIDTLFSLTKWRNELDFIIVLVFSGPAFVMADMTSWMAQRLGKPVIFWLHGGNLPSFTEQHPGWVKRILCRGQAIVSPSVYLVKTVQNLGLDATIIPNVLELEEYPFKLRQNLKPKILWMRAFHEIYHPQMAVKVLAGLKKTYPQARLTMAGQDKGELAQVQQLARQKGVVESIQFPGFVPTAGKQALFSQHDIFINTNRVDNMPVTIIEAAAFGLPIIATEVGGIPFLLQHQETALLVADGDVNGMVAGLKRLLVEPELATKLSFNGRQLSEKSSWVFVKQQWENLFAQIKPS